LHTPVLRNINRLLCSVCASHMAPIDLRLLGLELVLRHHHRCGMSWREGFSGKEFRAHGRCGSE
jgi:hypothetical protein